MDVMLGEINEIMKEKKTNMQVVTLKWKRLLLIDGQK
jgi:hypothetical protein